MSFDWWAARSDHRRQMELYLAATGAPRGALVYLSADVVEWVPPPALS